MKIEEIRSLTKSQLSEKLVEIKKQLFTIRFQRAAAEAVKPHVIRSLKRSFARVKTALNENK